MIEGPLLAQRAGVERPNDGRGFVLRPALFKRLSAARGGSVVLVCAAAGSGKSELVRAWLGASRLDDRAAWVSVERAERDGQRFWLSVLDALAAVTGSVARAAPSPTFRGELLVERLLTELGALEEPAVLVVDDLHELRSDDALAWLTELLARLPLKLLVVLTTREDPRLGLHRLRLAGDLTEVRAPDLRFSLEETRELLQVAGIRLSEAGIALLHDRTEGWVAGLRLAAISLAHHPDPERFVREFSGSERTVAGYLLAEVLERQPADVRELLLRTSVLDRVSGSLADFLSGGSGSERILQQLEEANAFVSSLDASRSWFRYHQLFAELLQLELRRVAPASVVSLHRAAAQWYEQEGDVVAAVRHAQSARDWVGAARLLADHYIDLTLDGRPATVRELVGAFPGEIVAADPELALVFGTARLLDGEREKCAAYVELAQRLADVVPEERRPSFDVKLAEMKLLLARWRGDLATVLDASRAMEAALAAQRPDERARSDDHRAVALLNLGVAELWSGRLDDAQRDLQQALALSRRAGRPWLEIVCLGHLGIMGPWTGLSFSTGLQLSEEAVKIADARGWSDDPALVTALATGAMALVWLGRFDEADLLLEHAAIVLQPEGEPGTELVLHHARGLLRLAQSRPDAAVAALRAAERMQALLADEHPFALPTRARLLQAQARMGDVAAAAAAFAEISAETREDTRMRVTAAVIRIAEGALERAVDALAPVIDSPSGPADPPHVLAEAQVLDATAREQLGERRAAEESLERALELAEPEGVVLPFVLAPVRDLLERLPRYRTAHATLLRTILAVLAGSSPVPRGEPAELIEDLSEAELRVLRYLPSNLKAPEIAAELCVSGNTVRTHLRHIYLKLDAHDRNTAVERARELGLLAPTLRSRG